MGPDAGAGAPPPSVTAVVLTHRRPRLATKVVRMLVDEERFPPQRVIVVVNGQGGLDDEQLESAVRVVRLAHNLGPAGGFAEGLSVCFSDAGTRWAYLCEDDVALFDLPVPRVGGLVTTAEGFRGPGGRPVGAVVAYGRTLDRRRGATLPYRVDPTGPDLQPVDAAAWGATLVSRTVVDAGILPDRRLFFGFEDFDFFFSVQRAGFDVLVDRRAGDAVAAQMSLAGRDSALAAERPTDAQESAWRSYYTARNFVTLARRHGRPGWLAWHLAYSARRLQLSRSGADAVATAWGLLDGARGRLGSHPRFQRTTGEWDARSSARPLSRGGPATGARPPAAGRRR